MQLEVPRLGECTYPSPLQLSVTNDDHISNYTFEDCGVLYHRLSPVPDELVGVHFEAAGPREKIYFDPTKTKAGIVTCGGLCPGINNVIRALSLELLQKYKIQALCGYRYGYQGLMPDCEKKPRNINAEFIRHIHHEGGSILGSSRGPQDVSVMVDTLERDNISILFTIGGDGTLRGAYEIYHEITKRNLNIAIVAIPKTIDNDIPYIEKTFGFQSAVSVAAQAIKAARAEADGAPLGVGLVKLMGRHSGFIAASATLSSQEVDLVLVPEQPFSIEKITEYMKTVLAYQGHVVVVVAEGAGQDLIAGTHRCDASGNVGLKDIGLFLKEEIKASLERAGLSISLKYIDPSYMIRATPAFPGDSLFCAELGAHAAHAGMAGRTGLVVGRWGGNFTHVPMTLATSRRKLVDLDGAFWGAVVDATGQPYLLK